MPLPFHYRIKKLNLILTICLLCAAGLRPSFSQPITFNHSLFFNDTLVDESAYQVVEVENGFILCGLTDYANNTLVISGLDQSGNILWKKYYGKDRRHQYRPGYYDSMVKTTDGNFAMAVAILDSLVFPVVWRINILKFNPAGDTLWSKKVYSPVTTDRSCYAHGLIETNDKGFLVYGEEDYMGVMVKTDSLGNKEWLTYYGPNAYADYRYIFSVCQTADSGFIIGGHRENIGNLISGNPFVVHYDKSGNLKWEKGFGGPYKDYMGTYVRPVNDSIFMAVANYTVNTSGPPYYEPQMLQLQLITISDKGDVISNVLTGDVDLQITVYDLEKMRDGTFIASGLTWDYKSWLMNFSQDDDNMFFRMLEIPSKIDYLSSLKDILSCSDGGIIACGDFNELYNGSNRNKPWLIKTDRFGCVEMGCDSTAIYITDQPSPAIACNDTVSLGIEIYSIPGNVEYNWQSFQEGIWQNIEDDIVYQGFHDDTLIIYPGYIESQQEYYRCNFSNQYWSFYSDSVVVSFPDTLRILLQPESQSVKYGQAADFLIRTTGSPPVQYHWYHNSLAMEEAIDSVLYIQNVAETDTGTYHCIMSNECGEIESIHVSLNISNLGIDDENDHDRTCLSPNPTSGILNLTRSEGVCLEKLILVDISGKPLSEIHLGTKIRQDIKLDISYLSPGIYFLIIQTDNERIIKKILKL
jgi:hypothetical protein